MGDFDKCVMFEEETITKNADISKDKKNIFRYHKLSKEDKNQLYEDRPDLHPKFKTTGPNDEPDTSVVYDDKISSPLLARRATGVGNQWTTDKKDISPQVHLD